MCCICIFICKYICVIERELYGMKHERFLAALGCSSIIKVWCMATQHNCMDGEWPHCLTVREQQQRQSFPIRPMWSETYCASSLTMGAVKRKILGLDVKVLRVPNLFGLLYCRSFLCLSCSFFYCCYYL